MNPNGFRLIGLLVLFFWSSLAIAQHSWPSPEIKQMFDKAQAHQSRGELHAAIPIYRQAISLAPHMTLLYRELGQALYYSGDYSGVEEVINPLLKSGQADAQSYQILGSSYLAQSQYRKARKLLEKGLTQYPHSGILYYELGNVHFKNHRPERAAKAWATGIQESPDFHLNYYALAQYYMSEKEYALALIHGEIFVNLEQKTQRSKEARRLIYDAYKGLFLPESLLPRRHSPSPESGWTFHKAVHSIYHSLTPLSIEGISTETLTMIRTRFIMEWEKNFAQLFPFTLFSRHQLMIRNGYFDTYNQWLFGQTESMEHYQAWNTFHDQAMPRLESWLQANPYLPLGSDLSKPR